MERTWRFCCWRPPRRLWRADCYFLSALAETALKDSVSIHQMFIDNGDGSFTVRFFKPVNGQMVADYVTVDRYLPVNANGQFVYANTRDFATNVHNDFWVALAEKAFAQINES